jgi:hypothetical protein
LIAEARTRALYDSQGRRPTVAGGSLRATLADVLRRSSCELFAAFAMVSNLPDDRGEATPRRRRNQPVADTDAGAPIQATAPTRGRSPARVADSFPFPTPTRPSPRRSKFWKKAWSRVVESQVIPARTNVPMPRDRVRGPAISPARSGRETYSETQKDFIQSEARSCCSAARRPSKTTQLIATEALRRRRVRAPRAADRRPRAGHRPPYEGGTIGACRIASVAWKEAHSCAVVEESDSRVPCRGSTADLSRTRAFPKTSPTCRTSSRSFSRHECALEGRATVGHVAISTRPAAQLFKD